MDQEKLQAMAEELAKGLKTPEDLSQLSAFLTKLTVEAALKGEMSHHLGYEKSASVYRHSGNGPSSKTLKGNHWTNSNYESLILPSISVPHLFHILL